MKLQLATDKNLWFTLTQRLALFACVAILFPALTLGATLTINTTYAYFVAPTIVPSKFTISIFYRVPRAPDAYRIADRLRKAGYTVGEPVETNLEESPIQDKTPGHGIIVPTEKGLAAVDNVLELSRGELPPLKGSDLLKKGNAFPVKKGDLQIQLF